MSKTHIMFDSPEAAQPHTMQGWLSRDGFFYQDERAARGANEALGEVQADNERLRTMLTDAAAFVNLRRLEGDWPHGAGKTAKALAELEARQKDRSG